VRLRRTRLPNQAPALPHARLTPALSRAIVAAFALLTALAFVSLVLGGFANAYLLPLLAVVGWGAISAAALLGDRVFRAFDRRTRGTPLA
jgi:hypothetical protein